MQKDKKWHIILNSPLSFLGGAALLMLIALIALGIRFQTDMTEQNKNSEVINLRMALINSTSYPSSVGAADFAERVKQNSGGRIDIELFCNGRLGLDENSIAEQVQIGGIDIACVSVSAMQSFAPSLDLLQLPYMISDADHLHRVLDSELGQKMLHEADSKKILGLAFYDEGPRIYCNSVHPVNRINDLKGLRFGVPKNPLYTTVCELFGTQAEQLAHGDIYRSLKTGRINGLDDNLISYVLNNRYTMAKYVTLSNHAMPPSIVIASRDVFEKLSPEDVAIIYDAAQKSVEAQRLSCERLTDSAMLFLENGVCDVVTNPWTTAVFTGRTKEIYENYSSYSKEIAYIESLKNPT